MSDTPPTAPEWPIYRFRWRNVDLQSFKEQRRFAAEKLRRDAEILLKRAEQIEVELQEWAMAMEPADGE